MAASRSPSSCGCMEHYGTIVSALKDVRNTFWLQIFECKPFLQPTVEVLVPQAESLNLNFNEITLDSSILQKLQAKLN